MTDHQHDHSAFETLNDYVDANLDEAAERKVAAHLAVCRECADRHARLVSLLTSTRELPDRIDPPGEVWTAIRGEMSPRRSFGVTMSWWRLAAAAVVLVAVSSIVTILIVRRPEVLVVRPVPPTPATPVSDAPATKAVDASYDAGIKELTETLAQHRSQLDPATAAKVEASLHVIDLAIAEARQALAADPANTDLHDLLAASYERKLELLRRANQLSATI